MGGWVVLLALTSVTRTRAPTMHRVVPTSRGRIVRLCDLSLREAQPIRAKPLNMPATITPSSMPASRPIADDQACEVGEALATISRECSSFALVKPAGGRTAGLVATTRGAHCELIVASSTLRAGHLSLAFECGWRNKGKVSLSCVQWLAQLRALHMQATRQL